jgi:two-component system, chemotaxis family, protein-glutamate methylesterase/glutaminase
VGYEMVVMGTSLGGLHALEMILAGLPLGLPLAIAIAQHRHKDSDRELVKFLQRCCALPLVEAEDKQKIVAGKVYLAPANYHLLVEPGYFSLSTEAPVSYARPAIDVLFESAADAYGDRTIGIILTGASHDGAQGLTKIQAHGGLAIVQAPDTAESSTMPRAALNRLIKNSASPPPQVLPLPEIAPFLVTLVTSPKQPIRP